MILSASRRTDIPNYYSDWFINRLKDGFFYVRNPFNTHQISKIAVSPDIVDCIVFWTKNPENMLSRLGELGEYHYYFQFTLTGYGKDLEPGLPDKRSRLIPVFQRLSKYIGHERVIWRYDPVLLSDVYTLDYHLKAFEEIAEHLKDSTDKVIISFVDMYEKTRRNTKNLNITSPSKEVIYKAAKEMARIAKCNHMEIESCAEQIDLQELGVNHGSCIDKNLIQRITGCELEGNKDKNQRGECGCLESIEVGTYNTCKNGCKYCYANYNSSSVRENLNLYDVKSPLLCGMVNEGDMIGERKVKSLKVQQLSLDI